MIKESLDKKYGSSWHVVVGEGFGFDLSYEVRNTIIIIGTIKSINMVRINIV